MLTQSHELTSPTEPRPPIVFPYFQLFYDLILELFNAT